MDRKQIRLDAQAEQDIEFIRQHHSLSTRSAAIRFALREVARLIEARKDDQSAHHPQDQNPSS